MLARTPHNTHAQRRTGHALTQKWKRACREQPSADHAYRALTAALPADRVTQWMGEAKQADIDRDLRPDAMDIYDIQAKPCRLPTVSVTMLAHHVIVPGRRDVEATLMAAELHEDPDFGSSAAEWLSEGLCIEQSKYVRQNMSIHPRN